MSRWQAQKNPAHGLDFFELMGSTAVLGYAMLLTVFMITSRCMLKALE